MSYERKLQALGRALDRRVMRDVCVAEVPGGYVVSGLARTDERNEAVWRSVNFEITEAELDGNGSANPREGRRRWPF